MTERKVRPRAAAIILAGGRSSRMGAPKAGLLFEGVPLLRHLVRRLASEFPEIVVVHAAGQDLPITTTDGVTLAEDAVPEQGPVAGLCAGLAAVKAPLVFVASCDVPFLNPAVGVFMVGLAEGYDVVVPEWEGRLNPIQAVYRTRVLPLLAEQLAEGRRRPVDLFDRVAVRRVTEAEIRSVDPRGLTFLNMNTPAEYEQAVALWNEERP